MNMASGHGVEAQKRTTDIKIGRRSVLTGAMLAMLAAVSIQFSRILALFFQPVLKPGSFGGPVDIGSLAELPPVDGAPKLYPAGRFWLIHDQRGLSAIHSSCTHLECRFTWDGDKNHFVCPCHGSEFDKNGVVLNGPAARDLDRFPVQIFTREGEKILSGVQEGVSFTPVQRLLEVQDRNILHNVHVVVDTGSKIYGNEHAAA